MDARPDLPSAQELILPIIQALRELGGSARKADISAIVSTEMELTPEKLALATHGGENRFSQQMNGARVKMIRMGLLRQPSHGIWELTEKSRSLDSDSSDLVNYTMKPARQRRRHRQKISSDAERAGFGDEFPIIPLDELLAQSTDWRAQLQDRLYSLTDRQLESFFARIFADYGNGAVEVMQSDRQRGTDGFFTISGLFDVRYCFRLALGDKLLGSGDVTDLRAYADASGCVGAIHLTTGKFTEAAMREAERSLNPQVKLVDGEQLASTMRSQGMGLRSERVIVERVVIDESWFAGL